MKLIGSFALLWICTSNLDGQSIQDLDFLVGSWNTHELIFEGTDREYHESGQRTCDYYLDSTYIKCDTKASNKRRERAYTFLINFDKDSKQFRILKIFSDYSFIVTKSWKVDLEKEMIIEADTSGDQYVGSISFEDKEKLIWRGWSPSKEADPSLDLIFTETATRR